MRKCRGAFVAQFENPVVLRLFADRRFVADHEASPYFAEADSSIRIASTGAWNWWQF